MKYDLFLSPTAINLIFCALNLIIINSRINFSFLRDISAVDNDDEDLDLPDLEDWRGGRKTDKGTNTIKV